MRNYKVAEMKLKSTRNNSFNQGGFIKPALTEINRAINCIKAWIICWPSNQSQGFAFGSASYRANIAQCIEREIQRESVQREREREGTNGEGI